MRVGSLFSGIGGFDLGLEMAGHEVVWQAEIDAFCNKVLAKHWPEVKRYGDVRDIGLGRTQHHVESEQDDAQASATFNARAPDVDLICGGFPCQDVSVAGKRAGLDGERSGLWFEFQRVLSELRPAYAIIENVPGLLSSNQGRDFAVILDGLGECGFGGIGWRILDSQYLGVPQRRRRVFIVCGPTSECVEQILSLCESCGGRPAAGREAGEDVANPLGASATSFGGQRFDLDNETYVPGIAYALNANYRGTHGNAWNSNYVPELSPALAARDYKSQREDIAKPAFIVAEGGGAGEDGTGRGMPLMVVRTAQTTANGHGVAVDVAHTLDGAQGQAVAAASVRRLTPVECERLQGFPDGFTDLGNTPDGPRYRALGNAVTVNVAYYLGMRLAALEAALGIDPNPRAAHNEREPSATGG